MEIHTDLDLQFPAEALPQLLNPKDGDFRSITIDGMELHQIVPSIYIVNSKDVTFAQNMVAPGILTKIFSFSTGLIICYEIYDNPFAKEYDTVKNKFLPIFLIPRGELLSFSKGSEENFLAVKPKKSLQIYHNTMKSVPTAGLIGSALKGITKLVQKQEDNTYNKNGIAFNLVFNYENKPIELKIICEKFYETEFEKFLNENWTKELKPLEQKKEGRFVATACFGDYDSPEVKTLRNFRDYFLRDYLLGRLFISFYYSISPTIADSISRSNSAKRIVRVAFLTPIISLLRKFKN